MKDNYLAKMKFVLSLCVAGIILFSCTSNPKEKVEVEVVETQEDTLDLFVSADTAKTVVKEFKENLAKIEKKYGEQWGFCECVVANDSVNTAIMNLDNFDGSEFDVLNERSDYIMRKCQAFLGMDANKTPEERLAHEKKVKKCLKSSKK